jgi:copper chaperone CopZ
MTCDHCRRAIGEELGAVPGVHEVEVDIDTKVVRVTGDQLDDAALRGAIKQAGYEAA